MPVRVRVTNHYYIICKFKHHAKVTSIAATKLFLKNVVLGVEVRWSIRGSKDCGRVPNQNLSNRQLRYFYI